MPIDPSIITSGNQMAPVQLPDVNAMMQTQTKGLKNIYTLERQREADAAAAREQEQADTLRALAPAVASVFTDPSDAGLDAALAMVPAQFREAAQAQLDQLRAVPDVGKRKDMVRAALLQDDFGQALLAQLEPTANARLNADMAAQRAALDARKLSLEEKKLAASQTAPIATQTLPEDSEAPPPIDPKVKTKLDQAYPKAAQSLQSAATSLDQDIADVTNLIQDPGLAKITGLVGGSTPNVSADARRAQALLDKIMSGAGFSALQAMRDASPTGGALGNVSDKEGSKLEKSVAAFAQTQDYNDFRKALRDYLIDLQVAKDNVQSAFDETYSYRGANPSADIVSGVTAKRQRIEQTTPAVGPAALPPGVTVKRN